LLPQVSVILAQTAIGGRRIHDRKQSRLSIFWQHVLTCPLSEKYQFVVLELARSPSHTREDLLHASGLGFLSP
jgi:hypothetical protein